MAATRPMVTIQSLDGDSSEQLALPAVFTAPIRPDIVQQVCYWLKVPFYCIERKGAGQGTRQQNWSPLTLNQIGGDANCCPRLAPQPA